MKIQSIITLLLSFIVLNSFSQNQVADTTLANRYFEKANVFFEKQIVDSAIYYWEECLHIFMPFYYNENHPKITKIYNNLGKAYLEKNNFETSYKYLIKGLNIKKAIYSDISIEMSDSYVELSIWYQKKRELDSALFYCEKALEIRKMPDNLKNRDDSISFAGIYNNMGVIHNNMGQYEMGLKFHLHVLDIKQILYDSLHYSISESLVNVGFTYTRLYQPETALDYYLKAQTIHEAQDNIRFISYANLLRNIGAVYQTIGLDNFEVIKSYYNKSLKIIHEQNLSPHEIEGSCYNNMAILYAQKNYQDSTIKYFNKCAEIELGIFGKNHPLVANTYNNIAYSYKEQQNYNKSIKFYNKSIASLFTNSVDSIHPYLSPRINSGKFSRILFKAIYNKVKILAYHANDLENITEKNALTNAINHIFVIDTIFNKSTNELINEIDKISLYNFVHVIYKDAVNIALKMANLKSNESEKIYYKKLSLYFAEKLKAGTLTKAVVRVEDGKEIKKIRKEISSFEIAITKANKDSIKTIFSQKLLDSYQKLSKQNKKEDILTRQATVSEIQNTLSPKSTLIEYQKCDSLLITYYIDKENFKIHTQKIDSSFSQLILNYKKSIVNSDAIEYTETGHKLYKYLIEPLNIDKEKIKKLIVIPDGQLGVIPFEALLAEKNENRNKDNFYSDLHYLANDFSIVYHYSATLWKESVEMHKKKQNIPLSLLACAPVEFHQTENEYDLAFWDTITIKSGFKPLFQTESESKTITKTLTNKFNSKTHTLLHGRANEVNLKKYAPEYKIIHLTTHGKSDNERPELSKIVLSQPKDYSFDPETDILNRYTTDDGFLYAGEMFFMDLKNCDLFVMSACESGAGKIMAGEGAMAMHRGLFYSGAPNIIYALWKIPEVESKDLMLDFYDHIKIKNLTDNIDYDLLLQKAKLNLIKKNYPPSVWAGLVLLGK